jgi:menaquinone-dependent protoporphyrinogen oxidase
MFAGRLDAARLSFIERGMTSLLKVPTGDFRDWGAIAAWARELPGKMGL